MIRLLLLSLLVLPAAAFANEDPNAQEHCLVIRAIAVTATKERMELLLGTGDDIFDSAYRAEQSEMDKVTSKYSALFKERNAKGGRENPENHGGSFPSPEDRENFFRAWSRDITALEAAQSSEIAEISGVFDKAMKADKNPDTKRRLARINALWRKEINTPCYWGQVK